MLPVSIRFNNPGAINTTSWVRKLPGYLSEAETTPGNHTAAFATPEQGVACWWHLIERYRNMGITTVGGIVTQYGGGQDYSAYLQFVIEKSGLMRSTVIHLEDDATLLKLAKAMFWYEAGRPTPLTDEQIIDGFLQARGTPGKPLPPPPPESWLVRLLRALLYWWRPERRYE